MERRQLYRIWKIVMILFLFGLISGCIYFHLISIIKGSFFVNEWGIIADKYIDWSIRSCFVFLRQSLEWILLFHVMIAVCGFLKWGKIVLSGFCFGTGLLVGSLDTALLLCYELKTKIFFEMKWLVVLVFPIVFSVMMIVLAYSMSVANIKYIRNDVKKYLMYVFFLLFLDVVYMSVVSYVNL